MWQQIIDYALHIDQLELAGLVFGLLAVWFLIKQNILTWPAGIIYVFISFVIFWRIQLYGDFILHVFFLVLNVYGWYYWRKGDKKQELKVTHYSFNTNVIIALITGVGVLVFGLFLQNIPYFFEGLAPASVPYWDATTSILSVTGMWLTTRKKIENWYYWLAVDIIASIIYIYKGIYFYSFLYGVYILMAVWGYLEWKKDAVQIPK
tara:strand:- start:111983 stop:112600 length:618 start_codon:yes stop_codon:yes gene_type:complete